MKIHLVLAEKWPSLKKDIAYAEHYLKTLNVSITTETKNVDVSNPDVYDTDLSWSFLKLTQTKSLKAAFIFGAASPKYQAEVDCVGLLVAKDRALEEDYLWGQHQTLGTKQILEIYCQDKDTKRYGHRLDAYVIIHEIFHALAKHHNVPDTLHEYQDDKNNKTHDAYRQILLTRIIKSPMGLLPRVQDAADKLVAYAESIGTPIRITEGFRSNERQNELYRQRPRVTNARGGESTHNYGVAFDVVFRKEGYDATAAQWKVIADFAKTLGLSWGGDWSAFVDKPHFEMMFGKSIKAFQENAIDWYKYYDRFPVFERDLYYGIEGEDVRELQRFLNRNGFKVSWWGAGSPNMETPNFGPATQRALIRFQDAEGIEPAAGYFGPITRKVLRERYKIN